MKKRIRKKKAKQALKLCAELLLTGLTSRPNRWWSLKR